MNNNNIKQLILKKCIIKHQYNKFSTSNKHKITIIISLHQSLKSYPIKYKTL